MKKSEVIKALRMEKFWSVIPSGNRITLVREFGIQVRKTVSFSLVSKKEGFYLEHPSYVFVSTISHFKSVQEDVRFSLNKTYLSSTIKMLKRSDVWPHIVNKNFIEVNDNNKKSHKGRVGNELKNLLRM